MFGVLLKQTVPMYILGATPAGHFFNCAKARHKNISNGFVVRHMISFGQLSKLCEEPIDCSAEGLEEHGELIGNGAWLGLQPHFVDPKADCIGGIGHRNPRLQDSMSDVLVLTKGSGASIKDTHPNQDINKRFYVVAGRGRDHLFLVVDKDIG